MLCAANNMVNASGAGNAGSVVHLILIKLVTFESSAP